MTLECHTLAYGNPPWLRLCAPTLLDWCNRHGYELAVWDDPKTWANYPSPKFCQIDMLRNFLQGTATHFLYADADIFIRPDAPRWMWDTGMQMATDTPHTLHGATWREWCYENYGTTPDEFWSYSNAGCWSVDRASAQRLLHAMEDTQMIDAGGFQDQHWMNFVAWKAAHAGMTFRHFPSNWNRWARDMEASWFVHLWGTTKEEDFDTYRKAGLLKVKPDGLRRNILPQDHCDFSKVVVLEFVQDAGLGNQLFEISAAYSIARTLNLPLRWMWRPSNLREFGLHHFGFGESPYVETPLLMLRAGQGNRALRDKAIKLITESKERFCGISCPFQDEACFRDHADEIRAMLTPPPFDLPNPAGTTPVGVQVRRGDYVKHKRLNVTTPEYFLNALEWMRRKVEHPWFVVVSDDPAYAAKLFEKQLDVTVMPAQSAFDGLRTLASCEAHIISNSTFGWWGAWLGESGPVIVPEHWHHHPGAYGAWEPVPARWIKLPIGQEVKTVAVKPIVPRVVIELPEPTIERAIVYPWHADAATWQELRFSLRSVEKHFEDKKCPVFIFGTKRPGWLKDNSRVQYRGAYTYSEALSGGVQVAKKVAWWNDDCCLLKPTTWDDISVPYYLKDVGPDFLKNATVNSNPWREGVVRVLRQLQEMGITDQKVFSTHLPYVWERTKALQVFEKFGVFEKFPMELAFFHLFPEGAKLLNGERTESLPSETAQFLNYTDRHLTPEFKAELIRLFPEPASWEAAVNFS